MADQVALSGVMPDDFDVDVDDGSLDGLPVVDVEWFIFNVDVDDDGLAVGDARQESLRGDTVGGGGVGADMKARFRALRHRGGDGVNSGSGSESEISSICVQPVLSFE